MTTYYRYTVHFPGDQEYIYEGTSAPTFDILSAVVGPELAAEATIFSTEDITAELEAEELATIEGAKLAIRSGADMYINSFFSSNQLIEILKMQLTLASENAAQPYIAALNTWVKGVYTECFLRSLDLEPDENSSSENLVDFTVTPNVDFSVFGSPPCTFTDIMMLADSALQSLDPDWSAPDISSYETWTRYQSSSSSSSNSSDSSMSSVSG